MRNGRGSLVEGLDWYVSSISHAIAPCGWTKGKKASKKTSLLLPCSLASR